MALNVIDRLADRQGLARVSGSNIELLFVAIGQINRFRGGQRQDPANCFPLDHFEINRNVIAKLNPDHFIERHIEQIFEARDRNLF